MTTKVFPEVACRRIVSIFEKRLLRFSLTVEANRSRRAVVVRMSITYVNDPRHLVVELSTWMDETGKVETIGPWDWIIADGGKARTGTDPNLGSAIATTYNQSKHRREFAK